MVVILITMCSIYAVTYLPFTIYRIIGNYYLMDRITQTMVEMILLLVYALSGLLNPMITLVCKEDYRTILFSCFKKSTTSSGSQETRRTENTVL